MERCAMRSVNVNVTGGALALVLWLAPAASGEPGSGEARAEQVLTGEVVALWWYMIEGQTGPLEANSARNVFRLGSPVAIKVDKTLYLVLNDDRELKNRLISWAGRKVTARGVIGRHEGRPAITLSSIERAKRSRGSSPPGSPPSAARPFAAPASP